MASAISFPPLFSSSISFANLHTKHRNIFPFNFLHLSSKFSNGFPRVAIPNYEIFKMSSLEKKAGALYATAGTEKSIYDYTVKEPMYTHNNVKMKTFESVAQQLHLVEEDPKTISSLSRSYLPYVSNGIKMMLLIGLLTFQSSQQAIADTEFASGMSPLAFFGDLGDISTGFASAFLLIFFSELGDKTFFIAALLAARNSGVVTFIGTFGALAAMTVISVVLGRTFHYVDDILPFRFGDGDLPLDDIAAVCLLVYFGITTLLDAYSGDGLKLDEEQKEAELAVSELSSSGAGIMAAANTVFSTFLLVFVAEWGDKSFFSTVVETSNQALAAASSPLGVIGGALAGHGLATLLAVIGGSLLGTFFSEKVIAYVGGVLFLVFAVVTLAEIVT